MHNFYRFTGGTVGDRDSTLFDATERHGTRGQRLYFSRLRLTVSRVPPPAGRRRPWSWAAATACAPPVSAPMMPPAAAPSCQTQDTYRVFINKERRLRTNVGDLWKEGNETGNVPEILTIHVLAIMKHFYVQILFMVRRQTSKKIKARCLVKFLTNRLFFICDSSENLVLDKSIIQN